MVIIVVVGMLILFYEYSFNILLYHSLFNNNNNGCTICEQHAPDADAYIHRQIYCSFSFSVCGKYLHMPGIYPRNLHGEIPAPPPPREGFPLLHSSIDDGRVSPSPLQQTPGISIKTNAFALKNHCTEHMNNISIILHRN